MGMEHRWGRRQATDVVVQVITKSDARGTGRMANVSLTGAYLETKMTLRLLALVYLESVDRNLADDIGKRIAASVVRHDARGVGLEWYEPLTRATGVNALLATLGAAGVHELVGVYDRYSVSWERKGKSGAIRLDDELVMKGPADAATPPFTAVFWTSIADKVGVTLFLWSSWYRVLQPVPTWRRESWRRWISLGQLNPSNCWAHRERIVDDRPVGEQSRIGSLRRSKGGDGRNDACSRDWDGQRYL
jgi:hypothetical protein